MVLSTFNNQAVLATRVQRKLILGPVKLHLGLELGNPRFS